MRIGILLSHPAQFLFYKNIISELRQNGHEVFILIKSKDILSTLLEQYGWIYHNILLTERGNSKLQIFLSLIKRIFKIWRFAKIKKLNILAGTDASIAIVGKMLYIPCLTTIEDDYEVIKNLARLTYPFSSYIIAPENCTVDKWHYKKIAYSGFMKLAYLHPIRFTPDINKIKFNSSKPYAIIRLSKLKAHHDFGINGIDFQLLDSIIFLLSIYVDVYISSEKELPQKYWNYKLNILESDIHHYLYYAQILISDSQSMSVEAAMLGTPSIRYNDFSGRISVLEELEHKYHLTFGIKTGNPESFIEKIKKFIQTPNLKEVFQKRRQLMLADKIDVTAFMVWFIENYPQSAKTMKENPDFQYNFR